MSDAAMPVVVAGHAMLPVTRDLPCTSREAAYRVVAAALGDAGLEKSQVEGLFTTPPALSGPPGFMFSCQLAHYLEMPLKSLSMVECGGATSTLAVKEAWREIASGRIDVAVVVAVDARYEPGGEDFAAALRDAAFVQTNIYGSFDAMYGIGAPIPYYAMSHQRYMHEHAVSPEDVAAAPVLLREHAALNPLAEYREPIDVEQVLASNMVCPPTHLLECSPFASGAAAAVLVSEGVARELGHDRPRIRGLGEWHDPAQFAPLNGSITSFVSARRAAGEAYAAARVTPEDIDVAEVYGVFAATELMLLEDLGFAQPGKAARALREGSFGLAGKVAVDTSGGRLSLGHPAGVTPLMELCEVAWQLRGEAGERQVRDARLGLVHSEHGMLNGSMVLILEAA